MKENTVVAFQNPSDFQKDPLTEVLQAGARELLAQAVEAEVSVFLGSHAALVDAAGRRRVVRNGYLPERFIQTGIGPVSVRQPRVRDRGDGAIRFTSAILPRYLRRAKSLEDLLPWLYLKGISTGDFGEALAALLGSSAPGLSASTITRLKEVWGVEAERWQRRDLTAKRYVYFWVDGIYFSARMEEEKQCILVIVGATDKGQKELIAIADGYRESEQSWLEVLLDLKRRGLEMGPQLALGDGALGFWKALRQVYPGAREQRCWVHKTGNVLNKLPKGLQKKAKLADGLLVAPQPRRLAPAALFGESIVEGREALGTRDGDQEVPPDEADQSLDLALVVALARPAEPVLEQIVGLKLREDARSLPLPIAQDPGNRQLGVVVQDGSGDAAEEGKRRVVAIAECFGRLRRIGRNKATITVGKVEGKEVDLP